jgi:hypothetical protein
MFWESNRDKKNNVPRSSPHVAGPRAALDHGHPSILIHRVNRPAQPESFVKCKKERKKESMSDGYNARERGQESQKGKQQLVGETSETVEMKCKSNACRYAKKQKRV